MSNQMICTDCDEPIPNGTAVIRSRGFDRRAWHRACFAASHSSATEIPAQRAGDVRVAEQATFTREATALVEENDHFEEWAQEITSAPRSRRSVA